MKPYLERDIIDTPFIAEYPNCKKINTILHKTLMNPDWSLRTKGGANITDFYLHLKRNREVNLIVDWVESLVPIAVANFARNDSGGVYLFNPHKLRIEECWGAVYNKGDGVMPHNHFPYALTFSYYVNTPKGSSPLIINEKEYVVKPGQVYILSGLWIHGVRPNSCNGRSTLVGNIMYKPHL